MLPKSMKLFAPLSLALAVVAAAGCASLPDAPVVNDSRVMEASGTPQSSALLGIVGGLVKLVVRTLNLVGSVGGTLTNGRWTVVIPPNAVSGTATVSLGVSDSQSSACQLEIDPVSKNQFSVPVTLVANCGGLSDTQLRNYAIFWYNPSTKSWVEVAGSTVDLNARTVSAPLQHFSTYACGPKDGKAGW